MSSVKNHRYVVVPVTALWSTPMAPRDIDGWAIAPLPDVVAWLADLDAAEARLGVHGRVLTQLESGEPVVIIGDPAGVIAGSAGRRWLQVAAPTQPSSLDPRGYPGWVPAEHVGESLPEGSPRQPGTSGVGGDVSGDVGADADADAFVEKALSYLGVSYLWGGMCDVAMDCSGLVHLSLRRLGMLVPRDAGDQYDACEHLPAADAQPGDLAFFARVGGRPHHVGIVTSAGRMIHAPETGTVVVEEPLTPYRESTLIGAGRLPWRSPAAPSTE